MNVITTILGIGSTLLDKLLPSRSKAQDANLDANAETERVSGGRMTPRKMMMYILCYELAFEVIVRPWAIIIFPDATLPPPMLKDLLGPIATMFGW